MKLYTKKDRSMSLAIVRKFFPDVTSVTDADDNTILEVSRTDSTSGTTKSHNQCAFAKACQRKFQARGVIVSLKSAYIIKKDMAIRYTVPESVSREIISFDRKGGFAEGEYQLNAPTSTNRLGARQERPEGVHIRKDASKRKFKHITTGIRAMLRGKRIDEVA
jgi:hypothetical protein